MAINNKLSLRQQLAVDERRRELEDAGRNKLSLRQQLAVYDRRRELEDHDTNVDRLLMYAQAEHAPEPPISVDEALAEVRKDRTEIRRDALIAKNLRAIKEGRPVVRSL